MSELIVVVGVLLLDNQPLPNQDVLLISEKMEKLLGVCMTAPDGQFGITLPAGNSPSKAILLAKVKGEFVTVIHKVIELVQANPVEIKVDTGKDFFTIEGRINSSVGWPKYSNIFLDPLKVDGVPEQLERFFKQKSQGVFDSHFLEIPVQEGSFSFRVKRGIYRIGGEYINYDRPNIVNPDFNNYVVNKVTFVTGNGPLSGDPYSGFILEVKGDSRVTLSLRIVKDEEIMQ